MPFSGYCPTFFQGSHTMSSNTTDKELLACTPVSVNPNSFNPNCTLAYGLTLEHVRQAMDDFIDFLGFVNRQLYTKGILKLESFLMPANFSSIVGEFMNISIPKYCSRRLLKNLLAHHGDTEGTEFWAISMDIPNTW